MVPFSPCSTFLILPLLFFNFYYLIFIFCIDQIFVVHGGLSRYQDITLKEIDELDRKKQEILHPEQYEDIVIFDLLWSDPQKKEGIGGNARGNNCITFGPDVTEMFLKKIII